MEKLIAVIYTFWKLFSSIIGGLFIIIIIILWLGFFGIIPSGDPPDDGFGGRYQNEVESPFYPLR